MTDDPREVIERLVHNARGRNIINPGEVVNLDMDFGLTNRRFRAPGKLVDGPWCIVWTIINPRRPNSDRIQIHMTAVEARAYLDEFTFRSLTRNPVLVEMECSCGCRRYCDFKATPDMVAVITEGLRRSITALTQQADDPTRP
jgi:hypothetical protein